MVAGITSLLRSPLETPTASAPAAFTTAAGEQVSFAETLQNVIAAGTTSDYEHLPKKASTHFESRTSLGDSQTVIGAIGRGDLPSTDETVRVKIFDEMTHTVEVREIPIHSAQSADPTTVGEFVDGLNQIPGLQAQVGSDGRLRVDSNRPGTVFTIEGDAGGVVDALGQDNPELREVFESFVGEFFFGQMLKEMRKSLKGAAYMDGGHAEEMFTNQLDQFMARDLSKSSAGSLSHTLYDQQFNLAGAR